MYTKATRKKRGSQANKRVETKDFNHFLDTYADDTASVAHASETGSRR